MNQSLSVSFVVTLIILIISYIIIYTNVILINVIIKNVLIYLFLISPLIVLSNILNAYIQAKKDFKNFANINSRFKLISTLSIILFIWLFGLIGIALSMFLSYVYVVLRLVKLIKINDFEFNLNYSKSLIVFSLYSMLTGILGVVNNNIDILVIDYAIEDKQILGQYAFVSFMYVAMMQITSTVQTIVLPYFSENYQDKKYIFSKLFKAQSSLLIISIAISIVTYIIYPYFIEYIYQEKYKLGTPIFNLYLIKFIIFNVFSLIGVTIISLGLFKWNFYMLLFLSFISPFATYLFITEYNQFYGAAYSQIFIFSLNAFILYFYMFIIYNNYEKYIRIADKCI